MGLRPQRHGVLNRFAAAIIQLQYVLAAVFFTHGGIHPGIIKATPSNRYIPTLRVELPGSRPLACFAGIWTNWTSVRKVKEGETTNDLYAFLTTEPNAEIGAIHPKAVPVILTTQDQVETWMTAPPDEALKLQRPLAGGSLRIVARGVKDDPGVAA